MVRQNLLKRANRYLRKYRKWPHSPYKTKWHQTFSQQQAMETLRQAARTMVTSQEIPKDNLDRPFLLSTLINSFNTYECDPIPNAYYFVLKTLISTSQLHHIPSVLDHLQRVEKFETPEYVFTYLIRSYGNADKIQEAVNLFYRIPKFRCVPSVCSLNSLISVLCMKRECLKMAPQVLLKSLHMNIRMEESTFRILVKALCRIKRIDSAIQIQKYMIDDGYSLDGKTCSLIMSSLCEQSKLTSVEAISIWEEMRKLGFCLGIIDYSNMIKFLVKAGKGMDAFNILNQMKLDQIKPDIVCYTMVLSGIIAEGNYRKADELFDELLVLGLVPDVYTYNVCINGLCKQNKMEAAVEMVTYMEELDCKPNVVTCNTLLGALCKSGEVNKARDLVRKMRMRGVELNLHTYRIMLDGLVGKAEFIEACALLEEMLDKCFYPQSSTFDNIISGICQKGLVDKAHELKKKMVAKYSAPGATACAAPLL